MKTMLNIYMTFKLINYYLSLSVCVFLPQSIVNLYHILTLIIYQFIIALLSVTAHNPTEEGLMFGMTLVAFCC